VVFLRKIVDPQVNKHLPEARCGMSRQPESPTTRHDHPQQNRGQRNLPDGPCSYQIRQFNQVKADIAAAS